MGTSMTYSQRQKAKQILRNRAFNRNKIPPHMEKYYRYRVAYMKSKCNKQPTVSKQQQMQMQMEYQLNNQQISKVMQYVKNDQMEEQNQMAKQEQKQQQKQIGKFFDFPRDIPSIQHHSQLRDPQKYKQSIPEYSIQQSLVSQYSGQKQKKVYNQTASKFKNDNSSSPFLKYQSNLKTYPNPTSHHKQPQQPQNQSISQLPYHTNQAKSVSKKIQNNNYIRKSSSNSNSNSSPYSYSYSNPNSKSNSKQKSDSNSYSNSNHSPSNKISKTKTQSNHALSEIILQRQPCFTIHYGNMADDIKEEYIQQSKNSRFSAPDKKDTTDQHQNCKLRTSQKNGLSSIHQKQSQIISIIAKQPHKRDTPQKQKQKQKQNNLQQSTTLKNYTQFAQIIQIKHNPDLLSTNSNVNQALASLSFPKQVSSQLNSNILTIKPARFKATSINNSQSTNINQNICDGNYISKITKTGGSQLRPRKLMYF